MAKEKVWVCVYRDTIEEHIEDDNLAEILVEKDFLEQYFKEFHLDEYYDDLEDFLNEYVADDTEDFYEYAKSHDAVIDIKILYWDDIAKTIKIHLNQEF